VYETVKKEDLEKARHRLAALYEFQQYLLPDDARGRFEEAQHQEPLRSDQVRESNKNALTVGLNGEFYARADGWRPLQEAYALEVPDDKIVKMDPGLLYNALKDGQVQVALGLPRTDASRASTFWSSMTTSTSSRLQRSGLCEKDTAAQFPELEKIFGELARSSTRQP